MVSVIKNGIKNKTFVYQTTAGNGNIREWGRQQKASLHFVTFSFSGNITIEVTKFNSTASSVLIKPNRLGIAVSDVAKENGNRKITFKLRKAEKVSVEFNDDLNNRNALMIFADTLEKEENIPKSSSNIYYAPISSEPININTDKEIVYFKPGVYNIGFWDIPPAIKQIYISGGAYVIGYLNRNSKPIKINGRGVISNEGYNFHYPSNINYFDDDYSRWYLPINIKGGQNHLIEGITLVESSGFNIQINATNSIIENVKICGFRFNNDGITVIGKNIEIKNCFLMVNDDALVLYVSNLLVSNCIFWQLQGSVFQLGWRPHSMNNITISNCDVLYDAANNSEGNVGFINAMNYQKATEKLAIIENVKVNNIYFDTPIIRFLDIRGERKFKLLGLTRDLNMFPWIYKNFTFDNIHFSQDYTNKPIIYLHGFNEEFPISNFNFKNIFFNKSKSIGKKSIEKIINSKNVNTLLFNSLRIY